ncbi:Protein GVQW1, partial [Plecturocebus cupreus]
MTTCLLEPPEERYLLLSFYRVNQIPTTLILALLKPFGMGRPGFLFCFLRWSLALLPRHDLSSLKPLPFGFQPFSCLSLPKTGFHHVDQVGLDLLTSSDPSVLTFQSARIIGVSHCTSSGLLCLEAGVQWRDHCSLESQPPKLKQSSHLSLKSSWDHTGRPRLYKKIKNYLGMAGSPYVLQTGLELLRSSDPPALASQGIGITGVNHTTQPREIVIRMLNGKKKERNIKKMEYGMTVFQKPSSKQKREKFLRSLALLPWSAIVRSRLTTTPASRVQSRSVTRRQDGVQWRDLGSLHLASWVQAILLPPTPKQLGLQA